MESSETEDANDSNRKHKRINSPLKMNSGSDSRFADNRPSRRRRFIGAIASVGVVALSGCIGDDSDDESDAASVGDNGAAGDDSDAGAEDEGDESTAVDLPSDAYAGPDGSEPEPVELIGNWLLATNKNDAEAYNSYLHTDYAWPDASAPEDLADTTYLNDLVIQLEDENIDAGEIEDLRMMYSVSSRDEDNVINAADGVENAVVSREGTTVDLTNDEDDGNTISTGEHLLAVEDGEWKIVL